MTNQVPESLQAKKPTVLPRVNLKHVLLIVYVFPVTFYPLMMLLSAALSPAPGQEKLRDLVQLVLFTYPLFLLPTAYLFSVLYDKNPRFWRKGLVVVLVVEYILALAFALLVGFKG